MTEWVPILEGFYEVSIDGRLRRAKPGSSSTHVGRIVKTVINNRHGYCQVQTSVRGHVRVWRLHAPVASAFLGPPAQPGLRVFEIVCTSEAERHIASQPAKEAARVATEFGEL